MSSPLILRHGLKAKLGHYKQLAELRAHEPRRIVTN